MRIQLDFPEDKVRELRALMDANGIDTYKELFNNSLTLFEWALKEVKAGHSLGSIDETTERYRILVMPVLETAKDRAKQEKQQPSDAELALVGNRK